MSDEAKKALAAWLLKMALRLDPNVGGGPRPNFCHHDQCRLPTGCMESVPIFDPLKTPASCPATVLLNS